MKKKYLLFIAIAILCTQLVSAQSVTKDSISILNKQKETLKIEKNLNQRKLDLAKMENQLADKIKDVEKKNEEAQKAASDNESAASNLSDDSQDKKKAKKARKAANNAEDKAKDARKAKEKLDDLNDDIKDLRKEIANDERKLSSMMDGANSGN